MQESRVGKPFLHSEDIQHDSITSSCVQKMEAIYAVKQRSGKKGVQLDISCVFLLGISWTLHKKGYIVYCGQIVCDTGQSL